MKVKHVRKVYHNKEKDVVALSDVSFEANQNGIIVLLGSSGCGKSTLLNILSGVDTEYEGSIEDIGNLDYITQDFRLFESMTIHENLKVVSSNEDKINELLEMFSLVEHKNKKVRKCSNGQKKRVQFIRALLQNPSLLLCDEPTAALDHENAKILMDQLKNISKNVQIFLVTHDIALAQEYADRILHIKEGIIFKDEVFNEYDGIEEEERIVKKSVKDTLYLVYLEMKSRVGENILMILLGSFMCFALFVCIQLFTNVDQQTRLQTIWENSLNIVQVQPKQEYLIENRILHIQNGVEEFEYGFYAKTYVSYDLYKEKQINEVVENTEKIMAVEAFYDFYQYETVARRHKPSEEQLLAFQTDETYFGFGHPQDNLTYSKEPGFYPLLLTQEKLRDLFFESIKSEMSFHNDIYQVLPLENSNIYDENYELIQGGNRQITDVNELSKNEFDVLFTNFTHYHVFSDREVMNTYLFHPYELVNETTLPLLHGRMPENNGEVLLSLNTAEFLVRNYGFTNIEDLLDQTIEIVIPNYQLAYSSTTQPVFEPLGIKVVGISTLKSDEKQIFFTQNDVKTTLLKDRIINVDELYYTTLKFILDPSCDFETVALDIENQMNLEYSVVQSNLETLSSNKISYKDPTIFMIYAGLAVCMILCILIFWLLFNKNRIHKEKGIMQVFGYSSLQESMIRIGLNYLIVMAILLPLLPVLIQYVNKFAQEYSYESFMTYSIPSFLMITVLVFGVHLLIERRVGKDSL